MTGSPFPLTSYAIETPSAEIALSTIMAGSSSCFTHPTIKRIIDMLIRKILRKRFILTLLVGFIVSPSGDFLIYSTGEI